LIASTNADLEQDVKSGKFRADLYYRLHVIPIVIPPLRERNEDIKLLVNHFLKRLSEREKAKLKGVTEPALKMLCLYPWPGNVRELENTIERAIILCEGKKITPEHLAIRIPTTAEIRLREGAGLKEVSQFAQMEAERGMIVRVLTQTRGNKRKAAEILKIDYTTLFEKIKKYNLQEEI